MIDTTRPRLAALTSARFFAALHVVLFHATAMKGFYWAPHWWRQFAGAGYVAVTFFFVLSGFILVYTYAGREVDWRGFWRARFARLYPSYLLSIVMAAPFFFFAVTQFNYAPFAWMKHHLAAMTILVVTMLQAWAPRAAMGLNGVAWAVSVEVFFYVVFTLSLVRFSRLSNRGLAAVCVAGWVAALALAVVYTLRTPDYFEADPDQDGFWLNALKFNPLVRLPEFVIGVACGLWYRRGGHSPKLAAPLVLAGALAALIITALSQIIPYPVMHTGLYAPAFAAIICGLALQPRWAGFLESRWLVLLGESSYCLYLFHPMFIGMSVFAGARLGAPPLWLLGGIIAAVSVGLLVFRYFEEPARKRLRGQAPPMRPAVHAA